MKPGQWTYAVAGLSMLFAAGLALALKPTQRTAHQGVNFETVIPRYFGDWKIDASIAPVIPSPDLQANINKIYEQIVSRTYVNSRGERMMLMLAYGGDQSSALKAHRQEVCYAAQGFEIQGLAHVAITLGSTAIPVTRMLAVQGQRSEPVTYWLTMGDEVVLGHLKRLLVQLRYGLRGEIIDGTLVRISNLSTDPKRSYQAHEEFMSALLSGMKPQDASRLLGKLT